MVEFGYNRKDVLILCTLPLVGGYLTYYGLQKFAGLNPIEAGNYVQVIFVFVLWLFLMQYNAVVERRRLLAVCPPPC